MERATLIERVQAKLPDKDPALVEELTDRAIEHFCAFTKRTAVPDRAGWLLVDLAVAFDRYGVAGYLTEESTGADAPVSSVKRGDTTIQYDTSAGSAVSVYSLDALDARIRRYAIVRAK